MGLGKFLFKIRINQNGETPYHL